MLSPSKPLQSPVRETFGYQFLRSVLPFAALATAVSSIVVYLTYVRLAGLLSSYLVVITVFFVGLRIWYIPRIRKESQVDLVAWLMFSSATVGNMIGATTAEHDSAVSASMLIVLASLVFVSTPIYFTFVFSAVIGQIAARVFGGHSIEFRYQTIAVLCPTYAVISRLAISRLKHAIASAKDALQSKINELEAEKELRAETERQLLHAQKMEGLGLLAAGVAHDFNNHLQAICSFASLIEMGVDDESYPGLIQSAACDASDICRQMLTYAGRTQDAKQVFDIVAVVAEVRPMLIAGVPKSIAVSMEISQEPIYVLASKTAVQQCLTNLVRNAAEAIDKNHGEITVRICRPSAIARDDSWRVFGVSSIRDFVESVGDNTVLLEVADDGCGMNSATLDCAFDPYFSTKESGHGFGLATSLGIVRSLGGVIRAKSIPGHGTTIQILMPGVVASHETTTEAERVGAGNSLRRILIVDDEDLPRESTATLLRNSGFDVRCADTAASGLKMASDPVHRFDVLMLDYAMPEMNGIELLESLRLRGITTAAVLCSGYAKEEIFTRQGVKPDAFLAKPFQLKDLMTVFSELNGTQSHQPL